MKLAKFSTPTLLDLRRQAEARRDWRAARQITEELVARGRAHESRRAL